MFQTLFSIAVEALRKRWPVRSRVSEVYVLGGKVLPVGVDFCSVGGKGERGWLGGRLEWGAEERLTVGWQLRTASLWFQGLLRATTGVRFFLYGKLLLGLRGG